MKNKKYKEVVLRIWLDKTCSLGKKWLSIEDITELFDEFDKIDEEQGR